MVRKVWLLGLMLLVSGCMSDDEDGNATDGGDDSGEGPGDGSDNGTSSGTPPAAIHVEGRGVGAQGMVACDSPSPATCFDEPFTLDGRFQVMINLVMGSPAADYDLFLLDGGGQEIASSTNTAGTADSIDTVLEAGSYTVRVWAWEDAGTGYTLDVTFAAP